MRREISVEEFADASSNGYDIQHRSTAGANAFEGNTCIPMPVDMSMSSAARCHRFRREMNLTEVGAKLQRLHPGCVEVEKLASTSILNRKGLTLPVSNVESIL